MIPPLPNFQLSSSQDSNSLWLPPAFLLFYVCFIDICKRSNAAISFSSRYSSVMILSCPNHQTILFKPIEVLNREVQTVKEFIQVQTQNTLFIKFPTVTCKYRDYVSPQVRSQNQLNRLNVHILTFFCIFDALIPMLVTLLFSIFLKILSINLWKCT